MNTSKNSKSSIGACRKNLVHGHNIDSRDFLDKLARSCGYGYARINVANYSKCYKEITCQFLKNEDGQIFSCALLDEMYSEVLICGPIPDGFSLEDAFVEKLILLSEIDGFTGFMIIDEMNCKHIVWRENETIEQLSIRLDLECTA